MNHKRKVIGTLGINDLWKRKHVQTKWTVQTKRNVHTNKRG